MSKVYDLLGDFQSKFRFYLIDRLTYAGVDFHTTDQDNRQIEPKNLELSHFKWLVQKNKDAFRDDFGSKVNNLPTWLDDLREIRNKVAHYSELTKEDEELSRILVSKIGSFAKLDVVGTSARPKVRNLQSDNQIKDPVLDSILLDYPTLQIKCSKTEYRIYRDDGSGKGSIWIMPQTAGYAVVTTGKAQRLDAQLERLTGKRGMERSDRPYKRWTSVTSDVFPRIFSNFAQI